MLIQLNDDFKTRLLQFLKVDILASLEYRLYMNDYTPVHDSGTMDFVEVDDSGYNPAVRPTGMFGAVTLNGAFQAEMTGVAFTETFTLSEGVFTIYGYYVTDPGAADLYVFGQRADDPFTVTATGQTFTVTPRVQLDSLCVCE